MRLGSKGNLQYAPGYETKVYNGLKNNRKVSAAGSGSGAANSSNKDILEHIIES